ncbi:carbon-monoxide dehydrogenase medium subunit [Anaerosphaera aminiphila DSM 21120]|uniref:Carbon-monoxide dehydrogenase medium subunit n=1 Tax=Anaerosphaera aminiphila DSM 21120 TaxID=1120995 RepID=A0A1M5RNI2_9FIRM|nr:FAD binding domain-containing protein [Anaerosphaera aminiphila]SHH27453.1 carbon-monoxide dehydrogenase medium subunit [Anaerosphaera aminiphila DSM 21120]
MFYSPRSEKDLVKILKDIDDNTYIIAGGTDLIIKLRNKKAIDYSILDITKLKEWKNIREDEKNIYIGSLVTMTELCESDLICEKLPALYWAAHELGSTQIRNKATIGGNISNASQSADTLLSLYAYDSEIKIVNGDSEEVVVSIEDFVTGREKTILKKDEAVKEIIIKKDDRMSTFQKVGSRKAVTISKVSCAVSLKIKDEIVNEVRVFLGAVGVKPVRANLIEEVLLNKSLNEIDLELLYDASFNQVEMAIPTRASKYYKRVAIEGLMEEILGDLINYG